MLDAEALGVLVERLRAAVPRDVREAAEIRSKAESVVSQAISEAQRIRSTAERESRGKAGESAVAQAAEERAKQIAAEAERQAQRVRQQAEAEAAARRLEADRYALKVLESLNAKVLEIQNSVSDVHRVVSLGMEQLQGSEGQAGGSGR